MKWQNRIGYGMRGSYNDGMKYGAVYKISNDKVLNDKIIFRMQIHLFYDRYVKFPSKGKSRN